MIFNRKTNVEGETSKRSVKKIIASCLAAVLATTAVLSSVAWLTSSDKITNHMDINGSLSTSVIEKFTPTPDIPDDGGHEEVTPGQAVTKTVSIANNGDTDAFVRVSFTESVTTKVEGESAVAGNGTALTYSDAEIANYSTKLTNDGTVIPSTITVAKNDAGSYIAYVTSTKQKVNLKGVSYDADTNKITLSGDLGITYATVTTTSINNKIFATTTKIDTLKAGQTYTGVKLTQADVDCLAKYANDDVSNLYLSCLGDGTPFVLVLDDDWADNWTDGGDGYFYYNRILDYNDSTEALLDTVVFLPQMTNDYANASYDIEVAEEGIQATVACIKDMWGADVTTTADTAIIGKASISTTGAIADDR